MHMTISEDLTEVAFYPRSETPSSPYFMKVICNTILILNIGIHHLRLYSCLALFLAGFTNKSMRPNCIMRYGLLKSI